MPKGNIYGAGAAGILELFGDYVEGGPDAQTRPVLALSASEVDEPARNAIEKSLAALGFGSDACLFASLTPIDAEIEGGDILLDPQALFLLVEGIDPLHVIAADEGAVRALETAYRTTLARDSAVRIFGRTSAAFKNLNDLMKSDAGKQRAWRVFKALA